MIYCHVQKVARKLFFTTVWNPANATSVIVAARAADTLVTRVNEGK